MEPKRAWWKEAVFYQIYPRSFYDSDGDGIGDLEGIRRKLDYLQGLGVDAIWLCPVYPSPNVDNGYDVSDYRAINPEYGTMADFDRLLAEAHAKGIRVVMDLVVNHTSDRHPWFIESRSSKDNPKRDYYIWRKGKADGRPPSNWASVFGGPAWEYDAATGEYYLHLFSVHQPDLNWDNPRVVEEVHDIVRWWLDKGVDGFRLDVINHIAKAEGFPDAQDPQGRETTIPHHLFTNLPKVHEHLRRLNREVLSRYDAVTVGETPGVGPEDALLYVGEGREELDMLFHFEHMGLDATERDGKWGYRPWSLRELKRVVSRWQTELHGRGWIANYWNNHDQPRAVSRFGDDGAHRKASAKLLATLLFTLEGTPFIYQGEEIGMTNVRFPSIADYRDVETLNFYRAKKREGWSEERILQAIWRKGRDNARTPMQWSGDAQAGFTSGTPWIGVNPNYTEINVEEALRDPDSILHYYRALIDLRKSCAALVYGAYRLIAPDHPEIFAYTRTLEEETLLVLLNFSAGTPSLTLPRTLSEGGLTLLLSNYGAEGLDREVPGGKRGLALELRPYEARVYRIRRR